MEEEFGVEVELKVDFLVVRETLERMGICNREKQIITPSCYIISRGDTLFICHFKELLAMEGYRREIEDKDISRRNSIITMLQNWDLIEVVDETVAPTKSERIFVLPYAEKGNYKINHKFRMRKSKKKV